jgi:hypothetical protein
MSDEEIKRQRGVQQCFWIMIALGISYYALQGIRSTWPAWPGNWWLGLAWMLAIIPLMFLMAKAIMIGEKLRRNKREKS